MPDFLTTFAQTQPDKPAVIDDRPDGTVDSINYATLEARSNQLANVLLAHGVRQNTRVVWCGKNSIGTVIAMMLPYSIGFLLIWSAMLVVWMSLDWPLGPGVGVFTG